ncbi:MULTISPECIES: hypothetical protein [Streptomyces]|uniref:DUF1877 family protein n=1 Tax=Streptomyces parvus TaxID=66428 RepID=A0A5D4JM97_9ACTN|nr:MULTISPECIES: hypothetical protein [Streptomyces]PVC98481.1 hypothetical protein DBP12_10525 [Streptomyces sp. CS014]TYR65455.1 hypothetical protein FY004_06190 [Streptomyces parvus]
MSIIVKFFAAPDDTAAALYLGTGPGQGCESLSLGNFDPLGAVVEWQSLLTGSSLEDVVEADEPRVIGGEEGDGCLVFAISSDLATALADAEGSTLRDAADAWARLRAEEGEIIDGEIADAIMSDVAALVGSARRQGQGVYCWVA